MYYVYLVTSSEEAGWFSSVILAENQTSTISISIFNPSGIGTLMTNLRVLSSAVKSISLL